MDISQLRRVAGSSDSLVDVGTREIARQAQTIFDIHTRVDAGVGDRPARKGGMRTWNWDSRVAPH